MHPSRVPTARSVAVIGAVMILSGLLPMAPLRWSWRQTPVFINEIHDDNTGTDAGEFLEIAGPAGTNLTGWSIVLYTAPTAAVYDTRTLSGTIPTGRSASGRSASRTRVNGHPERRARRHRARCNVIDVSSSS